MAIRHLDAQQLLQQSKVFEELDAAEKASLIRELIPMSIPGGNVLFARGEIADALYILKSGSLGLFCMDKNGHPQLITLIKSGEVVGAYDMLSRQPRRLEVRALRDSELLRLPRAGFEALVQVHPKAVLRASQLAIQRMTTNDYAHERLLPRTFALLPFDAAVDVRALAEHLQQALAAYGECVLIDSELGQGHDSNWFAEREHNAQFVLYVDTGDEPAWRELCRRQADALLLIADADQPPAPWPDSHALDAHAALERPRYLLLRHPGNRVTPGAARGWLRTFKRRIHLQHVREALQPLDTERLARRLTQENTGMVFSGGGARGFAAIGMVKALREAHITLDAIGGTSIGAIISAGVALEWSHADIVAACRHAFIDGKPLRDRTLPFVSISRGRRTARLLREAFGEVDIEDMPLPYYCITSNLTSGLPEIRTHGRLWFWLRASCAIPGILPPVLHHRQVYVDGAVTNNLPIGIMREQGVGHIIAADIGTDAPLTTRIEEYYLPGAWKVLAQSLYGSRPSILPILIRTGLVNADVASAHEREKADLLLAPPVNTVKLLEWKAFDEVVNIGYDYTRRILINRDGTFYHG